MKTKKIISISLLLFGLIFSNCSNNEEVNNDTTQPVVRIQSPIAILNYSTDIGNSSVPYRVNLKGYATDETEIKTLKLSVTNSNGIIVLEEIKENNTDSQYIVDISETFESTTPGTFTAVFTAIDESENSTNETIIFTYSN